MAQKTQLPRKHINKKTTALQEEIIRSIQASKQFKTWAEAKNEYFENREKYDNAEQMNQQVAEKSIKKPVEEKKEEPKKGFRKSLTIAETKLGVTLVISKEECERLGLDLNLMTSEAIRQIKEMLKLEKRR